MTLTFEELHRVNAARCSRWHGEGWDQHDTLLGERVARDHWSGADWSNAMQGEAGEAGNVVKKLRRLELGLWGNRKPGDGEREALVNKLALELADTLIYADLTATYYGIDLAAAVIAKFNAVSIEAGFPERLSSTTWRCACEAWFTSLSAYQRHVETCAVAP